jgi:alkylhydroperoxidase/carboxymuconolactone decarboxylase family protein YurZ
MLPGIEFASDIVILNRINMLRRIIMEIKEFAGLYYADGAMDEKTRQLVALAAMLASGCST